MAVTTETPSAFLFWKDSKGGGVVRETGPSFIECDHKRTKLFFGSENNFGNP